MLFRRLILRPMLKQRLRALVTMLGVTLGIAVMLAIQLANQGAIRGFSAALDAVSGKAALEIQCAPLGIDEKLLPSLAWLREYGIAAPLMEADVVAVSPVGQETLRLIGIDALRDPALRDYALTNEATMSSGLDLMKFLGEPGALIITQALADRNGLKEGDGFEVLVGDRRRQVKVAAVLGAAKEDARALARQSLAVMDIAHAQMLLDRAGRIDRLELRLHDGVSVEVAEAAVRSRLPEGLSVQRPQRRTSAVEKMLAAFHFNLAMLSGIALVVGLFLIYNTISVSVMTRRSEIGMMRTLGVTRRQVLMLFMGEAFLLGVLGALLGVPVARMLAEGAIALTSATVDTLYVATAATVPPLALWHWLAALGIAVPLSLGAAALPAAEAARVSPVEAIRGQVRDPMGSGASGGGKAWKLLMASLACLAAGWLAALQPPVNGLPLWGHFSSLCAILAAALAVPAALRRTSTVLRPWLGRWLGIEGRLAASQIQASTGRLSVSVAALTVALALTAAIAVMVGSFRQTVVTWVDETMGADLYARPGTPPRSRNAPTFSEETLDILRSHPAVLSLDGHSSLDLPHEGRLVKLVTVDFNQRMRDTRMAFKTAGDAAKILQTAREKGQVLVSESFALRFGVREGGVLKLTTPRGSREFGIAAQFYDYSSDGGTVMMDRDDFEKWFGSSRPTHLAVHLKPGSDPEKTRAEMLRMLEGRSLVSLFTNSGLRAEILRIFDSTFAITWALEIIAVLVAMAGVAATMLTLVLERQDEIRLLRIAGADAGQVRRTIVIESGLLGLVSQVLGLAVGVLLSLVLIWVINPQSFGWSIRFHAPWWFLVGSTMLTLVSTLLAGLWPAWRVTRRQVLVASALLTFAWLPRAAAEDAWKPAQPGYRYEFPRDHGAHPEHKIEWWYFTGNLTDASQRRFGYQLTFFRIGAASRPATASPWALRDVWMAHFAVSDVGDGSYLHADRLNRAGPGLAGATQERVWNEDWQVTMAADGAMRLQASDREFSIDLALQPGGAAVVHGRDGISQKGESVGNASHYYSLVRMPTRGKIVLGGKEFAVSGDSWMDHEFGTSFLEKGTQGWDWFSVQLSDGSELMLFQLRGAAPGSNAGTWIRPDGSVLSLSSADFTLVPGRIWKSPTGASYPVEWRLEMPGQHIHLLCRAAMDGQEFTASSTPGLGYWEGAVNYEGTVEDRPVTGRGYLEMTGYSGRSMSLWFGAGK